jgi:hypothetical protein
MTIVGKAEVRILLKAAPRSKCSTQQIRGRIEGGLSSDGDERTSLGSVQQRREEFKR